ncbi:MAG: hypothetical protein A3G20_04275 [Acidobacteria bacterium RIFCSPLOWO2_12_FULL_59_11]|nr:MAG: hypothetical protein A3G20_04275 [Acidobacteria bacterium RIFCSPLOWO2_12_FULL_59_11]
MTGKPLKLKNERELLNVRAHPVERYENEQLAALTVYAIYWLRQWGLRPTVESITVLNHMLFPSRFGMDLFPEFPDANRTLRSLLQCGPKYRGWLSGSNRRGYAITPTGHALLGELIPRVGYPRVGNVVLGEATEAPRQRVFPRKVRSRDVDFKAEIAKLRGSRLFERWSGGSLQDRDLIHVYSALGVFDHTPPTAKRLKLNDLRDSARKAGDREIERLLDAVEETFLGLFSESSRGKSGR